MLTNRQERIDEAAGSLQAEVSMISHVRAAMPRRGGNSFYKDKSDLSSHAKTLCGAPVTDKDVDYRTAGTKKFLASSWPTCSECLKARTA